MTWNPIKLRRMVRELSVLLSEARSHNGKIMTRNLRMSFALGRIANAETPNANATVRRICKIARDALEREG